MDLCFKIRAAGLQIYHVPAAQIVHHGGASSSEHGSSFAAVMTREALHSYMVLNHGPRSARAYRLATGVSALGRLVLLTPSLVLGDEPHRSRRKVTFSHWRSVLSWSVGRQKWAKGYFAGERRAQEPRSVGG